jgi:hypothetical protein
MIFDDEKEEPPAPDAEQLHAEKDAEAAQPPSLPQHKEFATHRKFTRHRGLYGARLSKLDRDRFLQALREGATLSAAAMLIGRSRATIESWRIKGAAGERGYALFYYHMEQAMGHTLKRWHNTVNIAALKDPRLALSLLDRHDPDFRRLRAMNRAEMSTEIVAVAGTPAGGAAAGPAVAARMRYTLTWDDGEPVGFPGLAEPVPALGALPAASADDGEEDDLDRG